MCGVGNGVGRESEAACRIIMGFHVKPNDLTYFDLSFVSHFLVRVQYVSVNSKKRTGHM